MTTMSLNGKKALVTGGSRGIGRGIARELARRGAAVAINYLTNNKEAQVAVDEINSGGGRAVCFQADVSKADEVEKLTQNTINYFNGLDILVNNVGEFFFNRLACTTAMEWQRVLDSNLSSVFFLCKAVLPRMRRDGGGCIVNIGLSPVDRVRGAPNVALYSIAKTGVLILTRSLAVEEAMHNIRVNCVSPGLIDNGHLPRSQKIWMEKRVPMGRLGTVEEVARAVTFLASDEATYISGANLAVSGAWDWEDRPTAQDSLVEELFGGGN
jgi:NAD(P)-dependent dehydrogenase (short-subunit alcohol dehydrogenase family)